MKKIIAILLCMLTVFALVSCTETDPPADGDTTTTTTTTTATSSPQEIKLAELTQYLSTVDYNTFEVTEADKPYFMGRWFEKEINGEAHMVTVTDGSLFYFLVEGAEVFRRQFLPFQPIHPLLEAGKGRLLHIQAHTVQQAHHVE